MLRAEPKNLALVFLVLLLLLLFPDLLWRNIETTFRFEDAGEGVDCGKGFLVCFCEPLNVEKADLRGLVEKNFFGVAEELAEEEEEEEDEEEEEEAEFFVEKFHVFLKAVGILALAYVDHLKHKYQD